MKKIVVLLVVLLGCMPVTAFAQKQFCFKVPKRQLLSVLSWQPNIRTLLY